MKTKNKKVKINPTARKKKDKKPNKKKVALDGKISCFALKEIDAEKYFDKKRKKRFLRLFGNEEKIESITLHKTPVARFLIEKIEKTEEGFISKVEFRETKRNHIYINLNNCEAYYVVRRIGGLEICKSSIIEKANELPLYAKKILGTIIENGLISYPELLKKHYINIGGNIDFIRILLDKELIKPRMTFEGGYTANIDLPGIDDKSYNLEKYTEVEKKCGVRCDVEDKPEYSIADIADTLRTVFNASIVSFETKFYLYYYKCRYTDLRGRSREDILFSPKFK